jgi:hypothetical protein
MSYTKPAHSMVDVIAVLAGVGMFYSQWSWYILGLSACGKGGVLTCVCDDFVVHLPLAAIKEHHYIFPAI